MLKRILRYFIMAPIMILMLGCIKDDVSCCNPGVEIQYYYTLNRNNTDLFGQKVHNMAIYIFDKDNLFYYYKLISDDNKLQNDLPIKLKLPAGDYTIVSWGGNPEWYHFGERVDMVGTVQDGLRKGITKLSDFRLSIQSYLESDDAIAYEPVDLYYGLATPIKTFVDKKTYSSIALINNIHKLNISITGMSHITQDTDVPLDIYCIGSNGRYGHDNTIDESVGDVKYKPTTINIKGDVATTSIKVMRLMPSYKMILSVVNMKNGVVYYNFDLLPYIMKHPSYRSQQDLDREEEFNIDLKIDNDLNVVIWINGWEITNIIPIML
ncbi:MAG: FimB/Mfa2 family fimbrial subunit [Rikenellaceae bacterium]